MFVFLWSNEQWCRLLQLPVDDDKTENNHQCKQKAIIFSEDGLIRFLFSLLWCNLNKNSKIDLVIDFRRSVYLDMMPQHIGHDCLSTMILYIRSISV